MAEGVSVNRIDFLEQFCVQVEKATVPTTVIASGEPQVPRASERTPAQASVT
jgi:hypothetical protein